MAKKLEYTRWKLKNLLKQCTTKERSQIYHYHGYPETMESKLVTIAIKNANYHIAFREEQLTKLLLMEN